MNIIEYRRLVIDSAYCPYCEAEKGMQCRKRFNDESVIGYVHDDRSLMYDETILKIKNGVGE